jgi:hypothetical protein
MRKWIDLLAAAIVLAQGLCASETASAVEPAAGCGRPGDLQYVLPANRCAVVTGPIAAQLEVRWCLRACENWYGACNSPLDLAVLDCKVDRDRCEARCFGR